LEALFKAAIARSGSKPKERSMRDWLMILTPIVAVMYFRVRPEDFAELLYWLTRMMS
jgi:hypothetical protein